MRIGTPKTLGEAAIWLVITVVSLSGIVLAAQAPVVETLSPVDKGISIPLRLVAGGQGDFFVTDLSVGGIVKFNAYGERLAVFKTATPPQGIALTADGRLIVSQNDYVAILDQNGQEVGRLGQGAGQFKKANGIAIDDNGYIYVVDTPAHCIQVFTANGQYSGKFGSYGTSAGLFNMPTAIAYDHVNKLVVVADTFNARLQFFDIVNHSWKRTLGSVAGSTDPAYPTVIKFTAPQGISFEYSVDQATGQMVVSRIYVVDSFQSCVQVIDPAGTGTFLTYLGKYGFANGQFTVPTDVVYEATTKRLMVLNGSGSLTLFGIDGGKSPVLDTTPPLLTIDAVPASATVSGITVTGTVSDSSLGNVTVNGQSAVVTNSTYTAQVALAAGPNTITVVAADTSGNTTTKSTDVYYYLPAPSVAVNQLPNFTAASSLTLSGSVDEGSKISISADTPALVGTIIFPTSTTWTATVSNLAEAKTTFTVTATRPYSLQGTATTSTIVDLTPPALAVSALRDGSYTSGVTQNVSGIVSDPNLSAVTVNGKSVPVNNGTFSTAVSLVAGVNTVVVMATDLAGNSSVNSRSIYFDATAPVINVASPADGLYTNLNTINISGSVDQKVAPLDKVTVAGIPAILDGFAWSASINLLDGLNTIDILATDLAGNTSDAKRTIILDVTRPAVAIGVPSQDLATNIAHMDVSGTASDDSAGITLTASVNGTPVPVEFSNGSFALGLDFSQEGTFAISVTATDLAGNASTATRTVIYDITPPTLTVDKPKLGNIGILTGATEPGVRIKVVDDKGPVAGKVVVDGSLWSADLKGIKYNPATIAVIATDAAGNSKEIRLLDQLMGNDARQLASSLGK